MSNFTTSSPVLLPAELARVARMLLASRAFRCFERGREREIGSQDAAAFWNVCGSRFAVSAEINALIASLGRGGWALLAEGEAVTVERARNLQAVSDALCERFARRASAVA